MHHLQYFLQVDIYFKWNFEHSSSSVKRCFWCVGALLLNTFLNLTQVTVQLTITNNRTSSIVQTDQDQLSLQRFSVVVLMVDAVAVLAVLHHFAMQQGTDIGTLLQINLYQSNLLRL